MDNMLQILLLVMLGGSGVYALYSVIRLQKEQLLFPNKFLYPSNCKPDDCTDVSGFIEFITPRILVFGIVCILLTIGMAISWFAGLFTLPMWLDNIVLPALGIGVFIWYMVVQNKVYKLFW